MKEPDKLIFRSSWLRRFFLGASAFILSFFLLLGAPILYLDGQGLSYAQSALMFLSAFFIGPLFLIFSFFLISGRECVIIEDNTLTCTPLFGKTIGPINLRLGGTVKEIWIPARGGKIRQVWLEADNRRVVLPDLHHNKLKLENAVKDIISAKNISTVR